MQLTGAVDLEAVADRLEFTLLANELRASGLAVVFQPVGIDESRRVVVHILRARANEPLGLAHGSLPRRYDSTTSSATSPAASASDSTKVMISPVVVRNAVRARKRPSNPRQRMAAATRSARSCPRTSSVPDAAPT